MTVHVSVQSMDGKPVKGKEWLTTEDGRHIPITPIKDIEKLAAICQANSERWFPHNHVDTRTAITHCTLGLAGEAGETANKVKKYYGYTHGDEEAVAAIIEELVDTLIYDLVLLQLFHADIPQAIAKKIAICEARWGQQ